MATLQIMDSPQIDIDIRNHLRCKYNLSRSLPIIRPFRRAKSRQGLRYLASIALTCSQLPHVLTAEISFSNKKTLNFVACQTDAKLQVVMNLLQFMQWLTGCCASG